jgi:[NiFe] hydrogenase diaphorase moiety small subunit
VRASRDLDRKNVFQFVDRGPHRKVEVNSKNNLAGTDIDVDDKAVDLCPVGAILRKRVGYKTPIGARLYDHQPIGSDIECK